METEIKTEEDRIIELLTLEGENNLYEDTDFIPNRQSLYETEGVIEDYDVDVANFIVWRRPTEIVNFPVYFSDSFGNPSVIQGTLPDETFIGVLMAVASYEDGILMENIIYSRPDDFKQFGVYTCRFYVEGEWVEAITDTRIPCIMDEDQRYLPIYSRSPIRKEMWISLIEKAYAKALGSYHAVTKVKIHEALLHLTGGSVQEIKFNEDIVGDSNKLTSFWSRLKGLLTQHILILAKPADPESKTTSNSNRQGDNPYQNDDNYFVNTHQDGQNPSNGLLDSDETENFDGIISDRLYTVVAYKEVGMNELVLLRCPWQYPDKKVEWEGDWSEASAKWDEYPDMLTSIQNDPKIKWKRSNPKGYLWMSFKDFMKLFHSIHICKLFKQESNHCHYYLAKGEWKDKYCGGPLLSIRDREEGSKHAIREELRGQNKATAAVIIDGDASWFSNPQYKLHSDTTVVVNLSLTPVNIGPDDTLDQGLDGNGLPPSASSHVPNVNIYVVQMHPSLTNSHPCVGDCLSTVLVAQSPKVEKGHEASLWSLKLQGGIDYFVVPTTSKRGQRWGYVLRIFASEPIKLEKVPKWYVTSLTGEWTKTQTIDSTGGPPRLLISSDEMKTTTPAIPSTTANLPQLPSHKSNENPKWCQNPQYHLSITDPTFMQGIHDDIYLKIILKRNDKISGGRHQQNQNNSNPSDMHKEPTVGLVICKPEIQEEVKNHASQIGKPKLNPFGEIMLSKPSSLKKKSKKNQIHPFNDTPNNSNGNSNGNNNNNTRVINKKITLNPLYFYSVTTFCNKIESCIYLPSIPFSWIPDGLIIVPCLSEKHMRGSYELEVYSNIGVTLTQLPDTKSKSIAGEWSDGLCGGSHLCPTTTKKNPKFELIVKQLPGNKLNGIQSQQSQLQQQQSSKCNIRITLSKCGKAWKALSRHDAVGCMIGFYIYYVVRSEHGGQEQMRQIYESSFVPTEEISTSSDFTLDYLTGPNEAYIIMPTTFMEGKQGSFVLSVSADCDFTLTKEQIPSNHK